MWIARVGSNDLVVLLSFEHARISGLTFNSPLWRFQHQRWDDTSIQSTETVCCKIPRQTQHEHISSDHICRPVVYTYPSLATISLNIPTIPNCPFPFSSCIRVLTTSVCHPGHQERSRTNGGGRRRRRRRNQEMAGQSSELIPVYLCHRYRASKYSPSG